MSRHVATLSMLTYKGLAIQEEESSAVVAASVVMPFAKGGFQREGSSTIIVELFLFLVPLMSHAL